MNKINGCDVTVYYITVVRHSLSYLIAKFIFELFMLFFVSHLFYIYFLFLFTIFRYINCELFFFNKMF